MNDESIDQQQSGGADGVTENENRLCLTTEEIFEFCHDSTAFMETQIPHLDDTDPEKKKKARSTVKNVPKDIRRALKRECVPRDANGVPAEGEEPERELCKNCYPNYVRDRKQNVPHQLAMDRYTICVSTCTSG